LWAAVTIGVALPLSAHAADKTDKGAREKCRASYEEAQELRARASLVEARAELAACISTCPASLRSDCETWLREIDRTMPRVTFRFVDERGTPISATLQIDGEPIRESEKELNPGKHSFRAEAPDHEPVEMHETIAAGETRSLVFTLKQHLTTSPTSPPLSPAIAPQPPKPPIAAYVLGGIGVAALATSGVLAVKGHVDKSDLTSSCAPNCNSSDVDSIRTTWWVAAGVGAGGAIFTGVAAYLFLNHRSVERGVAFTLSPQASGAHASISGTF